MVHYKNNDDTIA